MKTTYIDVMIEGRFLFQLTYEYLPIFKIDWNDVQAKVLMKRPSLRGKRFDMIQSNNRVFR